MLNKHGKINRREGERSVYLHRTFSIDYCLNTKKKKNNDFRFKNKQTDNKPYISNQRALLRYDAGIGRDKSHLITIPRLFKSFITNNLIN